MPSHRNSLSLFFSLSLSIPVPLSSFPPSQTGQWETPAGRLLNQQESPFSSPLSVEHSSQDCTTASLFLAPLSHIDSDFSDPPSPLPKRLCSEAAPLNTGVNVMKLWHQSVMIKGKRGLLEACLLMNSLDFSLLLSLSPLLLCAGIVLNTGWHCWRHLGQFCFDFIIHVSCSRLGPRVKDTSGFLLNSLLRIAL